MFYVVPAALLYRLGKKYPNLTGNGVMMKGKNLTGAEDPKEIKIGIGEYASGFALGLVPPEIRAGARGMQTFFTKYMSLPLMVTVGIGTDLAELAGAFTFANVIMIAACVIGAMVGAVLIGSLFKFYPIEIAITAGLDMAGGGGSGDVQILGACHRMELMSFAQISSRIGGAIMLIIASAMFGMVVN